MTRHVVFGTGQVGRPLVEQLVAAGPRRRRRQPQRPGRLPGAQVVGGDATDPAFTTAVCAGADVVYFCLNAMNYARWDRGVPAAAARRARRSRERRRPARRARQPLRLRPAPRRGPGRDHGGEPDLGEVRHPGGDDRGAAARPRARARSRSPSAGPRTTSAPAPRARPSARPSSARRSTGKTAQVMGDPDQPHSYSYTPDVAAASSRSAPHPGPPARSGTCRSPRPARPAQIIEQVYAARRPPAAGPRGRSHDAARARAGQARRCASTCTPSTSSPTAGSSTTASSAPRSATRHPARRGARRHPRVVPRRAAVPAIA